ncbi:2-nitropropane dioxygenase [Mycena leptocephala]|nr:2-nitropropane dioxygenase [Mycena leptocephala]
MAPTSTIREIHTPLTKLLGCKVPILLAPMSTGAGGVLAGKVTSYGGFSFIPAGDGTVETLEKEINAFKYIVKPSPAEQVPVGVGFLAWYLEAGHKDLLVCALKLKVKAVFFAFSDHMDRWVNFVRGHDHASGRRTIIFIVVHSAEQAAAAAELGADVVIAQGIEAGGHGANYAAPLLVQLSCVQKAIPNDGPLIVPMVASSALASSMATESYYTPSQRDVMVASKANSATERTLAFDYMVGALGWPKGIDGRALKKHSQVRCIPSETTEEYDAGQPIEEIRAKYEQAEKEGDASRIATWAGLGVGLLTKASEPAKDIMSELTEECFTRLKAVSISFDH